MPLKRIRIADSTKKYKARCEVQGALSRLRSDGSFPELLFSDTPLVSSLFVNCEGPAMVDAATVLVAHELLCSMKALLVTQRSGEQHTTMGLVVTEFCALLGLPKLPPAASPWDIEGMAAVLGAIVVCRNLRQLQHRLLPFRLQASSTADLSHAFGLEMNQNKTTARTRSTPLVRRVDVVVPLDCRSQRSRFLTKLLAATARGIGLSPLLRASRIGTTATRLATGAVDDVPSTSEHAFLPDADFFPGVSELPDDTFRVKAHQRMAVQRELRELISSTVAVGWYCGTLVEMMHVVSLYDRSSSAVQLCDVAQLRAGNMEAPASSEPLPVVRTAMMLQLHSSLSEAIELVKGCSGVLSEWALLFVVEQRKAQEGAPPRRTIEVSINGGSDDYFLAAVVKLAT